MRPAGRPFEVHFQTTGTLGDSYICACKLMGFHARQPQAWIHVEHTIEGQNGQQLRDLWWDSIRSILELCPGVRSAAYIPTVWSRPRISSYPDDPNDPEDVEMDYFPHFPSLEGIVSEALQPAGPYGVICCHSGKPDGKGWNTKLMCSDQIRTEARRMVEEGVARRVVLLGTEARYKEIPDSDLILNLVGCTSLLDAIALARGASDFTGPEGLLAFCALSGLTISRVFYTSREAVEKRIVGTPWERSAELIPCKLGFRWTIHPEEN